MKTLLLTSLFYLLMAASASAVSVQSSKRADSCTDPVTRKEWRTLTDDEKTEYLSAVTCLKDIPSRLSDTTSESLYDDFAYVHRQLDSEIHFVAVFLPWHRLFVHVYEDALQTECGYTGNALYWDWTQDSDSSDAVTSSPVLATNATGFGGDGDSSNDDCVDDGYFAGLDVTTPDDHCLRRVLDTSAFTTYNTQDAVDEVMGSSTYANSFRSSLEQGPHRGCHAGLAGDMANNYSPNDPVFFLHHGMIDYLWYTWQTSDDYSGSVDDYGGNRYQNDSSVEATLQDNVPVWADLMGDGYVVEDLMSTEAGEFCYVY